MTGSRPLEGPVSSASPRGIGRFGVRTVLGLLAVLVGVVPFVTVAAVVRARWAPLASFDADVVDGLNEMVQGRPWLVDTLRTVTGFGDNITIVYAFVLGIAVLLVRRERRLASYLAATGLGLALLVPLAKAIVGRARPIVDEPVAQVPGGGSLPSGHAMLSLTTAGALVLVALPYLSRRGRWILVGVAAVLVFAVGFTRLALGVHYPTDVLAGWTLGAAWLAATTAAFRGWEHDVGRETPPLREGLERISDDFHPGRADEPALPSPAWSVTRLGAVALGIVGMLGIAGWLITQTGAGSAVRRADRWATAQLVEARTSGWTNVADAVGALSGTPAVIGVSVATAVLATAVLERWRPALFVAVAVMGEVLLYFVVSRLVGRARPDLPDLTSGLPVGASWPSGHVAAAVAVYGSLAAIIVTTTTRPLRWAVLALPVVAALLVGIARVYQAAHYPTDVLAGALLGLTWLAACVRVVLVPAGPDHDRGRIGHR